MNDFTVQRNNRGFWEVRLNNQLVGWFRSEREAQQYIEVKMQKALRKGQ